MLKKDYVLPVYGWSQYYVENHKLFVTCYDDGEYVGDKEVKVLPIITREEFDEQYRNESFWYAQKITKGMLQFL